MTLAQRMPSSYPSPAPQPRRPEARPQVRPQRLRGQDLLPLAAVCLLVASVAAVTVVYLTAFAKLTAQGTRTQELDQAIAQRETFNAGLVGEVTRLQRRDRVEREARRLGLVVLGPEQTRRIELPAGAAEPATPAPADVATPAEPAYP